MSKRVTTTTFDIFNCSNQWTRVSMLFSFYPSPADQGPFRGNSHKYSWWCKPHLFCSKPVSEFIEKVLFSGVQSEEEEIDPSQSSSHSAYPFASSLTSLLIIHPGLFLSVIIRSSPHPAACDYRSWFICFGFEGQPKEREKVRWAVRELCASRECKLWITSSSNDRVF